MPLEPAHAGNHGQGVLSPVWHEPALSGAVDAQLSLACPNCLRSYTLPRQRSSSVEQPMNILTIETTCDETAAAVVTDGLDVLASVVASQDDLHRRFGGVVPEIASRATWSESFRLSTRPCGRPT